MTTTTRPEAADDPDAGAPPHASRQSSARAANYSSWAATVELWFEGQGRKDHLVKQTKDIPTKDQSRWKQIDASLCSVLWFSIDSKLQTQYRSFKTCYDVWTKSKKVYSNDINRLYTVVSNLISVKKQDMDMQSYLSKLDSLIVDLIHLCHLLTMQMIMLSNVGSFSWFLPLPDYHMTLTPSANKYSLVPLFLHMILFVNSYCGSPFLNLSLHQLLCPFLFPMILLHWFLILIIEVDEEVMEAIAPALDVTIAKGLVMLRSNAEPRKINSSLRFECCSIRSFWH
ncbi:hypothetical protein SESBI_26453 [Sesbania bispinosa]|nr:hypothetical protein SESBI_26453 [Sesbania bispinosa]